MDRQKSCRNDRLQVVMRAFHRYKYDKSYGVLLALIQTIKKFNSADAANCKFDVVAGGDYGYNSENRLKEMDQSRAYIREFFGIESNVHLP